MMILVTGATGFIGRALIRSLAAAGHTVRILLRPSVRTPDLPRGLPVEVAVGSLNDERNLRAAMVDVQTVFHLAGVERRGARASLLAVDINGTRTLCAAASAAGVERFFYLSHLGADRASAYPVFKAKAIAEDFIRRSGLDYTILRTAVVYGVNDGFTTSLAGILNSFPSLFIYPGDGRTLVQPLWVEDLVTCLTWALDEPGAHRELVEIGGPEYFTFLQVIEMVMGAMGIRRRLVGMRPPYLRALTVMLEALLPGLPVSVYWLDYLATNRTCALDSVPRTFNLMPSRMSQRLDYLRGADWRRILTRTLLRRRSP